MLNINKAAYGDHNMIIYDDLDDFRKIYVYHCKIALEEKNEIVLLSTTYESLDEVKDNLEKARIDVKKYMSEGSLVIIDSMRGFHGPDVNGVLMLVTSLAERAQKDGKSGVLCFGDPGTFFLLEKLEELVNYESPMPRKFQMKIKAFCCYHRANFDVLSSGQKEKLLECHHNAL